MREAAKWVMQVGAMLHKKGGPAMPLAERVFQHAVHLAKQLDGEGPSSDLRDDLRDALMVEQEGNNPELADAYTWLGATEAALGKTTEAETHYKAAARAIEERGVVDLGDKLLHQCIFFRNRDNREKYEATIRRWETAIRDAHKDGTDGDVALLTSPTGCQRASSGACPLSSGWSDHRADRGASPCTESQSVSLGSCKKAGSRHRGGAPLGLGFGPPRLGFAVSRPALAARGPDSPKP